MRTCVKGCRSNSNEEGVSFFHFPKVPSRFKSDEIKDLQQRRESWFAKIRMKKRFASIDNVDSYRVCSKHFVSGNDKNLMIPPFIQMTTLVHQMLIISPGKPAHLNETSDVDWAPTVSVTLSSHQNQPVTLTEYERQKRGNCLLTRYKLHAQCDVLYYCI